jgi:hypothetical protein
MPSHDKMPRGEEQRRPRVAPTDLVGKVHQLRAIDAERVLEILAGAAP